ncbi:type II toxin-antitoxin system RelE/ParE family toxin [Alcaligenes faecalis]|uniref:type II toxin-antitoxin system RelE/ParE family toxin n=1 Tax=Alcaligenes faecalis TaxID=511 RepID=UPI000A32997E
MKIVVRIKQTSLGNLGAVKLISDSVSEMRTHFGPGYRLYYARKGRLVYLLLSDGDKSSQKKT